MGVKMLTRQKMPCCWSRTARLSCGEAGDLFPLAAEAFDDLHALNDFGQPQDDAIDQFAVAVVQRADHPREDDGDAAT